jgi:hypothetical protein
MHERFQGRIAAGVVDITSAEPLVLAGSATAAVPFEGVEDPLEASYLIIDAAPRPVVIVGLDLLFAGPALERILRERLADLVPPDNLLLVASHTHSAPATDPTKPRLGAADPDYAEAIAERVAARIRADLGGDLRDATLRGASTRERFAVRRRARRLAVVRRRSIDWRPVVQGSDRGAVVDDLIAAVRIDDAHSGEPLAVLWRMACHPVGHPRPRLVSAHFPGVVRRHLREVFGRPDLPVVFLQGFSGDLRPRTSSTMRPARSGLERLRLGDAFSPFDEADYADWCGRIATTVERTLAAGAPLTGSGVLLRAASLPRERFLLGSSSDGPVEFRDLQIGRDLQIIAASLEVVSDYDRPVRDMADASLVLLVGCLGDVSGYAPTERMLREGGYEAHDFCVDFGAERVPAGVEEAVLEGFGRVTGNR